MSNKRISAILSLFAGILLFGITLFAGLTKYTIPAIFLLVISPFLGALVFYIIEKINFKVEHLSQIAKFCLIGGVSTLIEIFILNVLFVLTGIFSGPLYSVFKAMTFLIALFNSYFLNRSWTFSVSNVANKKEFVAFFVVNIVGLFINVSTASIVVNLISRPEAVSAKGWANLGAIIAVIVTMVWNFVAYKFIVFKKN